MAKVKLSTTNQSMHHAGGLASRVLATTTLALAGNGIWYADGSDVFPKHGAAYWHKATRGFAFSDADRVSVDFYNEVLWAGLMDGKP